MVWRGGRNGCLLRRGLQNDEDGDRNLPVGFSEAFVKSPVLRFPGNMRVSEGHRRPICLKSRHFSLWVLHPSVNKQPSAYERP